MSTWHIGLLMTAFGILTLALSGCPDDVAEARNSDAATPVVERVVGNLEEPVSLAFLSEDTWLVAERRSGRIRWIENGSLRAEPFTTLTVYNPSGYHEYGLLDLAVDPDYPNSPYVYAFYTLAGNNEPAGQRIVRLTVQNGRGVNPVVIVDNLPSGQTCCHNGGRLLFGADGKLYVTLGDTQRADLAQNYETFPGKVLRYNKDGSIPDDNPFEVQQTGWTSSELDDDHDNQRTPVYTVGHRNPFGIAMNPGVNDIYISENGPDRDDEINRLVAGDNYGWPEALGYSDNPRYRPPVWASGTTVTAPTGMDFYTGTDLPQFAGNLIFANYIDGRLRRIVLNEQGGLDRIAVIPEAGNNARLDVAMAPDGYLYFTSMNAIYRLRAR